MNIRFFIILVFLMLFVRSAFSQDDQAYYVVKNIVFSGNKISKEKIIRRELLFSEGDTLLLVDTANIILESKQNLMNTSLFNFVELQFLFDGNVLITLVERWYIWPGIYWTIEERNFNMWLRDMSLEKVTYGLFFEHENFRGRKESLKLLFKTGYNRMAGFSYQVPYFDKSQKWGFVAAMAMSGSHSVNYNIEDHEFQSAKSDTSFLYSNVFMDAGFTFRKGIHQLHKWTIGFDYYKTVPGVLSLNPAFMPGEKLSNLGFNYQIRFDYRNYKAYPLKGWYFDLELNLGGLISLTGEPFQNFFVKSTSRKYAHLFSRFYWASGLTFLSRFDNEFYFSEYSAMGFNNDYLRGYEYYVIPAKHYLIQKNNLKFEILPQKIINIPFIRTEKFGKIPVSLYANLFCDWGSADIYPRIEDDFNRKLLYSYGIGLDFLTYYDKVFRLEYSINRFRENGVFLHFTAPI